MASTVIQPIADRFKVLLEGLTLPIPINVPGDAWGRGSISPPAAEIELPDIDRTDLDQPETQLGADDWFLDFLVTLWFDLREPTASQKRLAEALEQWIAAIDADPTLGSQPGVRDVKVVHAARVYDLNQERTLVGYETTVRVWRLV